MHCSQKLSYGSGLGVHQWENGKEDIHTYAYTIKRGVVLNPNEGILSFADVTGE